MKSYLDIHKEGYDVVDNFLDDDKASRLSELCRDPHIKFFRKSKENWPPPLYSFTDISSDVIEVQNDVEIGFEFQWTDGEKLYNSQDVKGKSKLEKYPKEVINLISEYQDGVFKYLKKINYNIDDIDYLVTMPYKWPSGSSILWHDDGQWDLGLSLYLNHSWSLNCGGELMLENGKWVYPAFNRCVIIQKKIEHRVNEILTGCKNRYSLQTFIRLSSNPKKVKNNGNLY